MNGGVRQCRWQPTLLYVLKRFIGIISANRRTINNESERKIVAEKTLYAAERKMVAGSPRDCNPYSLLNKRTMVRYFWAAYVSMTVTMCFYYLRGRVALWRQTIVAGV